MTPRSTASCRECSRPCGANNRRERTVSNREGAAFGDVILLTIPYEAMPVVAREIGDPSEWSDLDREARRQGVALTSVAMFPGVRYVRGFSSVDGTQIRQSYDRQEDKLAIPLAGTDPEALDMAAQLVRAAGCVPVVTGDLTTARKFQPGEPGFRKHTTAEDLQKVLGVSEK